LTISVIICTRNRIESLLECLESMRYQTTSPDELIIVDSSDIPLITQKSFTTFFTSTYFTNTVLIYQHTKPSLTHQRNVGIDQAHGDVIYFFDDDVILSHDYIKEMQRIFAGHPHYGGGMGTITNIAEYKPTLRYALRTFFLIQRSHATGMFTCSGMPTHTYGTDSFKNVQVLGGCCCAYRAQILAKCRFDEYLERYAYMEDCDLSKRASRHCKLFFNPYARL